MTSILTEWGKRCVEKLIKGAIEEARFVFCFTCIAKEFEEERDRLKAERITLGQHAKVAIEKNKEIKANVVFWEEEVDKLIQEDTKTKETCFFGFCPNCIWQYTRGKELANGTNDIKRLTEKGGQFGNIELPRRLPDVVRYSLQDYIPFKSRDSEYKELLDALKDDNNYITGLQGMGGTGKTTLAKVVGKEVKESGQFTHVIDTTVSFTPDIKKIQDDIAGPLGLKWEDCNESDRPKILWDRLTNGQKILLILDDVWDQDPLLDFDAIGIPKRDNHKGCRVLVTTRSKQIFNKMNFDKSIELGLLSTEDAWIMFKKYAGISNSSSKHVTDKGRKIAKECKQLPVAIAVIASSLKGQQHRAHEWDVTLKSLKKHLSMDGVDDDMVGIYKCLKFSYDHMKDEKAKELFRLCSVLPEDKVFHDEFLTKLCIGAGLFGEDYGNYNDARNQVVVAKNKLLDSCLLVEVGEKMVKMHDLIRDVAKWIARKEIRGVNLSDKNQKSLIQRETNIKCLLLEGNFMDLFFCKFDASNLETLIVIMNRDEGYNMDSDEEDKCMQIPNSFFEKFVKLRVLYLSCHGKRSLSLPNSFQPLTNIRSLSVQMVDLGDISILGYLKYLEVLELFKCKIDELPSEITELEKFKLLNLTRCEIRMNNPFEVIERCSSLQELYFIESSNDFCQEITLPELHRYHIRQGRGQWNDSLSKYVVFSGNDDKVYFSKATLNYCIQTAEGLWLSEIKRDWRNLMPEIVPIEHGMNDLVELHISVDSQLQFLMDSKHIVSHLPNVFSNLVFLRLDCMEKLEELCNCPISFDSLNNLEKLTIEKCRNLRSLFKCSLNLSSLKSVTLVSCPKLVSVFDLSTSQNLPLLESFEISDCEQLENIFTYERRVEDTTEDIVEGDDDNHNSSNSVFINLKVIKIKSCDKLKYIFGRHQNVQLASLQGLELYSLPNFIAIFPEPSSIKGSSSVSENGSKSQTQVDPIKCSSIFSWNHICCYGRHKVPLLSNDQSQDCPISLESNSSCIEIWERVQCLSRPSHILCNIKNIVLSDVPKIKSVFILSIAPRMLLETLLIKNCDELKHIIVDTGDHNNGGNVFPKLNEVIVEGCKKLQYIIGHYNDDHQSQNEIHLHLPALESLDLFKLPSLVAMCSKQYRTTFPSLKTLELNICLQVTNVKSIGDFITHRLVTRSMGRTTIIKELSGNMEHFLGLESLMVSNSKVENIFCFNEKNGKQMNFGLLKIELCDLPMMKCLFVGSKNSFGFKNLTEIVIERCEKLETVFSTCVLRCLPQLHTLKIVECKELKHIIEDDLENKKSSNFQSSNSCFPKLKSLFLIGCNKLNCVFPISVCKELSELEFVLISQADKLEEIFKSEGDDQKVEIPNIEFLILANLPSLCQAQGYQFQAVKYRFIHHCQNLTLTSALNICDDDSRKQAIEDYLDLVKEIQEESEGDDTLNENPSSETINDFRTEIEVEAASGYGLNSSKLEDSTTSEKNVAAKNEPFDRKQKGIIEEGTSQSFKETEDQSIQGGLTSETTNEPSMQLVADLKQKSVKFRYEDVDIEGSQETTQTNNNRAMEELIEEDPLLALEKLLTGVQSFSIETLLQELKTLMDSSSDLDHIVSNQESKEKFISLLHGLNQHQALLPSDVKEFVDKVQNFFNDNIIKHATSQQVLKKHNELLDLKTELMNKLLSAKSTQTHIDNETSTANAQIHELSLQIDELRKKLASLENQRDDLKSLVNLCDVQKKKLKAECSEWIQQSKELLSALASSEINAKEIERARNLAKEGFAHLKSLFPKF